MNKGKLISLLTLFIATAAPSLAREPVLVRNVVEINGAPELRPGSILPYIKQQSSGFSLNSKKKEVFDSTLVKVSEESIRNHMNYEGYYFTVVKSETKTTRSGKVTVTYYINAGKRYEIRKVNCDDYSSDIGIHPGDFLSESLIETEAENYAAALRCRGYYGITKRDFIFEADTLAGGGKADLTVKVRGIPKIRTIDNVTISHSENLKIREEILKDLNTVHPGDIFNEEDIRMTYNRLSELKLFSAVNVALSENKDGNVDCDINLSESKLQGVSLDFDASTNSSGLIGLSPQFNWYHKNIFHGAETMNLSFMGDFQFKPRTDTRATELGVSSSVSFPRFLGPSFKDKPSSRLPHTEISASYNYQNRPEYRRNIASASFGYSGTLRGSLSYQLYPLQLNHVRIYGMDPDFYASLESNPLMRYSYQNHFDAGVGGTIHYASEQGINPKLSYWYTRLSVDLSGNVLSLFGGTRVLGSPYSQYVRGEWTLGRNIRFGRDDAQALAMRLLLGAGYAYGNSEALPFEKQFYAGGANSMRGWQARSLGPGSMPVSSIFTIPSQTGDLKIEANLEYRFPLFWKMEGALFTDIGNVWGIDTEDEGRFNAEFWKTLAADWGTGLRCNLDFMIIRVDCGIKAVDPTLREGHRWVSPTSYFKSWGYCFHFGIGYPF